MAPVQARLPPRTEADAGGVRVVAIGGCWPDALLALWLKLLGQGVIDHRPGMVRWAAVGLGVSATATWFLGVVSTRLQRRFRDKVTIALEAHVAHLQATLVTIAHQERPDYLDRLAMLRNQVFVLDHNAYCRSFRRADGFCVLR